MIRRLYNVAKKPFFPKSDDFCKPMSNKGLGEKVLVMVIGFGLLGGLCVVDNSIVGLVFG